MARSPLLAAFGSVFHKDYVERKRDEWQCKKPSFDEEYADGDGVKLNRRGDGSCIVSWSARHSGDYRWLIECEGTDVSPEDANIHAQPGKINAQKCVLFGYGLQFAVAGIRSHFMLQAGDSEGNAILSGGATLSVMFNSVDNANVIVHDLRDGRYLISYIINTAGTYSGRVQIDEMPDGVPFSCTVVPSLSCGTLFTVRGKARHVGTAGTKETFRICAFDAFGNRRRFGGDRLSAVLVDKERRTEVTCHVSDLDDGTYSVNYLAKVAGRYTLKCSWKRPQDDRDEEFHCAAVEIFAGPPSPASCTVTGKGLKGASPRCIASLVLRVADVLHNPRSLDPTPTEESTSSVVADDHSLLSHGTVFRTRDHVLVAHLYCLVDGESRPGGMVTIGSVEGHPECYSVSYRAHQEGQHALSLALDGCPIHDSPFKLQIQQSILPKAHDATFWCKEVHNHLDPTLATQAKRLVQARRPEIRWMPPRMYCSEVEDAGRWGH